jgi:hypothetical protein
VRIKVLIFPFRKIKSTIKKVSIIIAGNIYLDLRVTLQSPSKLLGQEWFRQYLNPKWIVLEMGSTPICSSHSREKPPRGE